jgi:hypothetical protein
MTVTPGRFAWSEMRIFAGWTLYFFASLTTIGFLLSGESFEPSGEYAVTMMPFSRQNSTTSSCGQDLETL